MLHSSGASVGPAMFVMEHLPSRIGRSRTSAQVRTHSRRFLLAHWCGKPRLSLHGQVRLQEMFFTRSPARTSIGSELKDESDTAIDRGNSIC